MFAAESGHLECVSILIDQGADVEATSMVCLQSTILETLVMFLLEL